MTVTPEAPASLRWLGHSTVLVELDGVRFLTDPLLRRRVLHLRRAAPLSLEGLERLDAVLISHLHHDHLDPPSLRLLPREATLVVPHGAGPFVRRRGFASVVELGPGEETRIGTVRVRAVYAAHSPSRRLLSSRRVKAVGYVLEGSRTVYFAGDTDFFPGMADLAPDLDAVLLPIWGWGPKLGVGHLDPRKAAEALAVLRPGLAVPIHWGTYYPLTMYRATPPAFLRSPAAEFVRAASELAPAVEVCVLEVGESVALGASVQP